MNYSVQVIGRWALLGPDGRPRHVRTPVARLIAFLALHGHVQRRAYVAGTLWPDQCERRAGSNLRSTLWRARTELAGIIDADASTLWLSDDVTVDLDQAMAAIRSTLIGAPYVGPTVPLLTEDVLPDWNEDWVWSTRFLYRQLRLQVHVRPDADRASTRARPYIVRYEPSRTASMGVQ